jgi:hypothetical protein
VRDAVFVFEIVIFFVGLHVRSNDELWGRREKAENKKTTNKTIFSPNDDARLLFLSQTKDPPPRNTTTQETKNSV